MRGDSLRLIAILALFSLLWNGAYGQKLAQKHDVEVSIELKEGVLYGSLMVPKGKKPKPVVLFIPGSGPTDRNCNSSLGLKSNSFLLLAEELYQEGIATLRIDKRSSGKSFETFKDALDTIKFRDFVNDVTLWIDWLKKDPRFSDVFVAGHSKGALVGNLASLRSEPDGFVSMAGAGRPIGDILIEQIKPSLKTIGAADTLTSFIDSLKLGEYMDNAPAYLRQMFPEDIKGFMAEWMSYDPVDEIKKLHCKVAIIAGGHDLQIPVEDAQLLKVGKTDAVFYMFEEMNHVLKNAPIDRFKNFAAYNQPNLPITEGLSAAIASFVKTGSD